MSHCAYQASAPGNNGIAGWLAEAEDSIRRARKRKHLLSSATRLTEEELRDCSSSSYKIDKPGNSNLQVVKLDAPVVIRDCPNLKEVSVKEMKLFCSKVSGKVDVEEGVLKIDKSELNGEVVFKGKKVTITSSKVAKLVLRLPVGKRNNELKRTLVLKDATITELVIIKGGKSVDMKYTRSVVESTIMQCPES